MMSRIQISLEKQLHARARQYASKLGVPLAEYIRRLVIQDLARSRAKVDVSRIFDLGSSGDSNIARKKDSMIGEAFASMLK